MNQDEHCAGRGGYRPGCPPRRRGEAGDRSGVAASHQAAVRCLAAGDAEDAGPDGHRRRSGPGKPRRRMKYILDVNVALKWGPKYPTPRTTPLSFHDESLRIRPLLLAPMVRRSWVYFDQSSSHPGGKEGVAQKSPSRGPLGSSINMDGNEPLSPPVPVFPDGGGIQSDAETAPLTGDERQRHFGWRCGQATSSSWGSWDSHS